MPLNSEWAKLHLPRDPDGPELLYGPYFSALSGFLTRNDLEPVRIAVELQNGPPLSLGDVESVELVSEKHGAIYHVARLSVRTSDGLLNFVMNIAAGKTRTAMLAAEFDRLSRLWEKFPSSGLPRPFLQGETICPTAGGESIPLRFFIGEWFDGFHEFHLTRPIGTSENAPLPVTVWDYSEGEFHLDPARTHALYRKAAAILTTCFDEETFHQIYPWHHAAGDFIVKPGDGDVEVRLVTARGYRKSGDFPEGKEGLWIAVFHFFINLTLRMRLDRLDGVGESAWADKECLAPVLRGFLDAWKIKATKRPSLPSPETLTAVFSSFEHGEWKEMAHIAMVDGLMEEGEAEFIAPRLEQHVEELIATVAAERFLDPGLRRADGERV